MRGTLFWSALAVGGLALACGGLPTSPGEEEEPAPAPTPAVEPAPAEPAPAPAPAATPESLFAPLDLAEVPPPAAPTCPAGTSTIRHPKGGGLEVYCATAAGQRSGPYVLVQGRKVVESATYADGARSGRSSRWSTGNPQVKVAEVSYAAGELDGESAEWDEQGRLLSRGAWKAGKKHGKFLASTAGVDGAEPTFGGACFGEDGAEAWTTTDAAEFVTRACP